MGAVARTYGKGAPMNKLILPALLLVSGVAHAEWSITNKDVSVRRVTS